MLSIPSVIFFGSFQHYSTKVLEALTRTGLVKVASVVTTPPRPAGRKKVLTKTPVHEYAEKHHLPVFTPEKLDQTEIDKLDSLIKSSLSSRARLDRGAGPDSRGILPIRPDLFVVAGYGQILPPSWLKYPTIAPLNLHFSLLPKYRGANPAEWAILMGEKETGVSLIKMEETIDAGPILIQEKVPIEQPTFQGDTLKGGDTRATLYEKLYALAGNIIIKFLTSSNVSRKPFPERNSLDVLGKPQPKRSSTPYARRLQRDDGFIPWKLVQKALTGEKINTKELPPLLKQANQHSSSKSYKLKAKSFLIDRAIRALAGFPGIWTKVTTTKGKKRLKVLSSHIETSKSYKLKAKSYLVLDQVQLEGQSPTHFNAIKNQLAR